MTTSSSLRLVLPWLFLAAVFLIAPRIFTSGTALTMMSVMGFMIIFALSYNMLLGQTGMLSFGHAVYYGLGGFLVVHAMNAITITRLKYEQIKPKMYVVTMHYGTKVFDDLLPLMEFLEETEKARITSSDDNTIILQIREVSSVCGYNRSFRMKTLLCFPLVRTKCPVLMACASSSASRTTAGICWH